MDFNYLHEVESIEFTAETSRPLAELPKLFTGLGFTIHDDVLSLDRRGRVPPWQHPSIVEVEVRHNGEEVFGFEEGEWNTISLKCLFATLPFDAIVMFIEVVDSVSNALGILATYRGSMVTARSLLGEFERVRDELVAETGEETGSEGLAILIQSTYPRRI